MLVEKLIFTFLTIVITVFFFSIIHAILEKLPKAQTEIRFRLKDENPFSTHLCQIFQNSNEMKNIIINIINKNEVESNKKLLLEKIRNIFENRGFEIIIDGISIKNGVLDYKEVYICNFLYNNKLYEISIKI